MNERIRELEKQATDYYSNGQERIFDRQKFAELIVLECVSIVSDAVNHREPASTYVDKIKQFFGVEE